MQLFSTSFSLRTAALASMVVLGACSKKNEDTPTQTTTYATTWTADGKNYTATTSNGAVNNGTLIIGASYTVSSSESYSLTLGVPAATGTYAIGSSATTTAGYGVTLAGTTTGYIAGAGTGSGTVTVTTLSATEIIGTFSFTGMAANASGSTKAITNGKFSIKR